MKRRILSILLSFALLCSFVPFSVSAASDDIPYAVEGGNIYFDKESGMITGCDKSVTKAVIPSEIDGVAVIGICDGAFFSGCRNLQSVSIPASVTEIGYSAFGSCTDLDGIWVDEANEFYSNDAFGVLFNKDKTIIMKYPGNRNESYVIPSTVTTIAENSFSFSYVTELTIPDSVTVIGNFAFREAYSIGSVIIPENITHIGDYAFMECYFLDEVYFMGNAPILGEASFDPNNCPGLKLYYIEGKEGWTSPTWNGYRTATWDPDAFFNVAYPVEGGNIYFDKNTGTIISADSGITAANIPSKIDGVTVSRIGLEAFMSCSELKSVTIPSCVTEIGSAAFMFCSSLTSVTIPGNIGSGAFAFCSQLTSVTISSGVTTIGNGAFEYCERLTSVTIPASVTTIEDRVFDYCTALTGIWVDTANTAYASDAAGVLFNKDKTILMLCPAAYCGSYTIPAGVTTIRAFAFRNCTKMTSVTIPDSVSTIELCAFEGCTGLKQVVIPAGVCEICESAFYNCTNLKAVYFKGDAPMVGLLAFYAEDKETLKLEVIPGLTLYYIEGKEGWSSPTWNGYPTQTWFGYVDVQNNAWYAGAVKYALDNGLMNGMSAMTFEPESSMTRAMLVTVLWRYAGEPTGGENSFTDVPAGQWYTDAVIWAATNGIVNGVGENKFDPDGKITREQMATILCRYANSQEIDTSARADLATFPDADKVSDYALDALRWAVAAGLINGSDGKLLPQGNATRAQVATILMRFIENVAK